MVALVKMENDGATSNSLTNVIMSSCTVNCSLDLEVIASKLLCFGVAAQGSKKGVTKQIKENHAPFTTRMYCCAHCLRLCVKTLLQLALMASMGALLLLSHAYFAHLPKKVT
jgi:hypothetical protein